MSETVLSIDNLCVTYKNRQKKVYAVKNASFSIEKGDAVGIVGESGSGKSTLAMALLRLLPARTAEVTGKADFLGRDLLTVDDKALADLRWKELSVVFQKAMSSFSPVHRIGEQIEDIYRVHVPNAQKGEARERAVELLKLVNLGDRVWRLYPHELSGGMLQRVAIAMSLLFNPRLLIMDEATTALDVVTQGQLLNEIKHMEETLDMTRIMITHDMSVVAASCSKVVVMYAGDIVEVGPVKKVLKTPAHPYTQGLLGSFPSLKGETRALRAIPGSIPDLSQQYSECIFAPRCPHAAEACRRARPEVVRVGEGWSSRCVLCGGEKA